MKNYKWISLNIAFLMLFTQCDFNQSKSGQFEKCSRKDGGVWEVSQVDEYRLYGVGQPLLFSNNLGVIGEYEFTKEDAPIPGNIAYFRPSSGGEEEHIIQASTPEDIVQIAVYHLGANFSQGDYITGYALDTDFDKFQMKWYDSTSRNDTIISHVLTFDNLGN